MIVMKFGGTSLADGERIAQTADIIVGRAPRHPVVVVSALAGVTDRLIEAADLAAHGELSAALTLAEELAARHDAALAAAAPDPPIRAAAAQGVAAYDAELRHMLETLAVLRRGGARMLDAVMSHGELWSSRIVVAALETRGVAATWVDARDVMVTDGNFGAASPDRHVVAKRAAQQLAAPASNGGLPVIQGFLGATPERVPTTIGRGGSDYTAAFLGAVLDVEEVEIWTDVDGLMTADPRVVPEARPLAEASYGEAAELSYFGARVLHPGTILPLADRGIPVRVTNTARPGSPGTLVGPRAVRSDGAVKSIASKRAVTTLNLRAPRMLGAYGFLKSMFEVFATHRTVVDVVATSEVSVSLTVEHPPPSQALLEDLATLGEVTVSPNRAIICVVGEGLKEMPGVVSRVFRAVGSVNIEMISQGASKINLTFVVRDEHAADVVRRLHREFFPDR